MLAHLEDQGLPALPVVRQPLFSVKSVSCPETILTSSVYGLRVPLELWGASEPVQSYELGTPAEGGTGESWHCLTPVHTRRGVSQEALLPPFSFCV